MGHSWVKSPGQLARTGQSQGQSLQPNPWLRHSLCPSQPAMVAKYSVQGTPAALCLSSTSKGSWTAHTLWDRTRPGPAPQGSGLAPPPYELIMLPRPGPCSETSV